MVLRLLLLLLMMMMMMMMSLQAILFENEYVLIPLLFVVELVLLGIWSRRRTPVAGRIAAGGLVVGPLMLMVQAVVETDAERIEDVCRSMALAVEDGDVTSIARHLSGEMRIETGVRTWDAAELLDRVRRRLALWDVEEGKLSKFETLVDGDRAEVEFQARCRLVTPEMIVPNHVSRWRLEFRREGDRWKIDDVRPLPTRWMPHESLDGLLR